MIIYFDIDISLTKSAWPISAFLTHFFLTDLSVLHELIRL